jgi:hypothetical protein
MDFLAMRSASRQPSARGSWLYGAGPFALIVATGRARIRPALRVADPDHRLGGVVGCPALVLPATAVRQRGRDTV